VRWERGSKLDRGNKKLSPAREKKEKKEERRLDLGHEMGHR